MFDGNDIGEVMDLFRLKTIASNKKEFLGPFVYSEELAEKKLVKLRWLVKKPGASMKLVEVDNFPIEAIWDWRCEILDTQNEFIEFMKFVENKWEVLNANKENFDEMEEGSA